LYYLKDVTMQLFTVEYGLQRINKEVSEWMIGAQNGLGQPAEVPFVATRGFDSVVWSRFYSREAYEKQQEAIQVSNCWYISTATKSMQFSCKNHCIFSYEKSGRPTEIGKAENVSTFVVY
jgi:hypothetical protein